MNTRLIVIAVAAVLCGCAGVGTQAVNDEIETRPSLCNRVDCRSTKIVKLFGLDNDVLADTNRFGKAQNPYVYNLTLPESVCGCSQAEFFLNDIMYSRKKGEPLRLRSVELRRTLPEDAGDAGLEAAYQSTCESVASLLGVAVGKVKLESPKGFLGSKFNHPGWGTMSSMTSFNLAEGQSIAVRAIDAIYTKRGNEFLVSSPAAIEIDFHYHAGFNLSRMDGSSLEIFGFRPKASKTIVVGPDCVDLLSASMNEKHLRRRPLQKD